MKTLWKKIIGFGLMAVLLMPALALAAGPKAAPLVVVADTRKVSGWMAWWTNLYNESHLLFAVITVIIIPVVGLIFGVLADLVMGHIGLDLRSRELAEH
jgi:hypothetical protein